MTDHFLDAGMIIDGNGCTLDTRSLAISGDRLAEPGAVRSDAERLDFGGYTLLPGLIDAHVHLFDWIGITDDASMDDFLGDAVQARLDAFLSHGVTTIRSCGDPEAAVLRLRAELASGGRRGPRLLAVGPGLTSRDGHPATTVYGGNDWYRARATTELDDADHARREVRRLAAAGVDAVKLLYEGGCGCEPPYIHSIPGGHPEQIFRLKTDVMAAALDEARRLDLRSTVHTIQQERALTAIELGADSLEHGVHRMDVSDPRLLALGRERGVSVAGTLTIMRDPEGYANVKRFHDAGMPIAVGTDTCEIVPRWGAMTLDEVEGLVSAGLTPAEAIAAATSGSAAHIGRERDLGALAPGMIADLIVVDGNPLTDISALRRLVAVIKDGELVVDNR